MCTVFTNDAFYLSARDDLLAVNIILFRKLLIMIMLKPKRCLSDKLGRDWMDILRLLCMC